MITESLKKLFALFFIFFSITVLGEELEDYYIQINAKNLTDDFFMIKYDNTSDEIYVGINSLFYFLEIYTLETDIEKRRVFGEINKNRVSVHFEPDECKVLENELYVKLNALKEKMNFKSANYNSEYLRINLEPNFELPYEERERGKVERLRLDQNREKEASKIDIEMPSKLITPGLFKVDFAKYNIEDSDYTMNYEYASQFLYGEFYLSGAIKPDADIDYGNLTYSNIIGDNDLIFGHFNMISPSFLNVETKVLGISFDNNDTYMTKDGGVTIIRGEARDADVVELYRNSFLIDYVNHGEKDDDKSFTGENFEFRLDDGNLNSNYTLKIYYNDGNIEERKVYSLSDNDILKKGKSRISLQAGKSDESDDKQAIGKYFYGFSDNITLGVGGMNLVSDSGREYKILENDILFRTGTKEFPFLVNYKNYYEYNEKENSFEFTMEQKIYDYNLKYEKNHYTPFIYEETEIKNYDSFSLGRAFRRNTVEFGVSRTAKVEEYSDEENSYKSIYALIDSYELSPVYLSFKMEKSIEEDNNKIIYNPYISYSGNNGMSIMADAEFEKDDTMDKYKQDYSLKVNFRRQKLFRDRVDANFGFSVEYSNETHKPCYGITFDIELDDLIYGRFSSDTRIDENGNRYTTNGVYMSKIIDISNPARQIRKNISLSNAWIHGKVFLDSNNNGIFDEGEKPLSNVGVTANNALFYTDENGNYVAEGLYSENVINLGVDRKTIDPMTKHTKGILKVKARKSAGMKIDIPISIVSMVTGNIWNTEDFEEREFIQALTMTTILLEKDGEVIDEIDPEFDGMFFFEDVPAGKYKIKFQYIGQENIGFSNPELDIEVKLENTEEGEYFEGFDTEMRRVEITENDETNVGELQDDLIGEY